MIYVEAEYSGKKIYIIFMYGDPVQKLKDQVWETLTRYGITRYEP